RGQITRSLHIRSNVPEAFSRAFSELATILPEVAPTLPRMPHPAIFGPTALLADGLRPSADNPFCEMAPPAKGRHPADHGHRFRIFPNLNSAGMDSRSEERRVGKECRSRWSPYH